MFQGVGVCPLEFGCGIAEEGALVSQEPNGPWGHLFEMFRRPILAICQSSSRYRVDITAQVVITSVNHDSQRNEHRNSNSTQRENVQGCILLKSASHTY